MPRNSVVTVKQVELFFFRHAWPVIADANDNTIGNGRPRKQNVSIVASVGDGVFQQILQHLRQAQFVAPYRNAFLAAQFDLLCGCGAKAFDYRRKQVA